MFWTTVDESYQFPISGPPGLDEALLKELHTCRVREKKLLNRYRKAVMSGVSYKIKLTAAEYLCSKAVSFAIAVGVNKGLPLYERLSLQELKQLAQELLPYNPINELVTPLKLAKKTCGFRVVCAFGPAYRTAHQMVINLLTPHFHSRPFQYERYGLDGVHRAVRDLRDLVSQGYVYVDHQDVEEFFPSFKEEGLVQELPLPEAVVRNVVMGRHVKFNISKKESKYHSYWNDITAQAHRGILQGAASSPLVGAMIVSRLNWIMPENVRLISYVDDFYLIAKSSDDLENAASALRTAFKVLPGGLFNLRSKSKHMAKDGIPILGHIVELEGGKIRITLSNANANIADERFEELYKHAQVFSQNYVKLKGQHSQDSEKLKFLAYDAIARLIGYTASWAHTFKLCEDVSDTLNAWKGEYVDPLIAQCGFDGTEIKAKAKKMGGWWWGVYPDQLVETIKHPQGFKAL